MDTAKETYPKAAEVPIACNLPEHDRSARGEQIADDILSHCEQVSELSDGYAFRFPDDQQWAVKLLDFVVQERKCCPFFVFELAFEPQEGPIWLRLKGSENVKLFIQQNFGVVGEGLAAESVDRP